jgi:hypothetical protein
MFVAAYSEFAFFQLSTWRRECRPLEGQQALDMS